MASEHKAFMKFLFYMLYVICQIEILTFGIYEIGLEIWNWESDICKLKYVLEYAVKTDRKGEYQQVSVETNKYRYSPIAFKYTCYCCALLSYIDSSIFALSAYIFVWKTPGNCDIVIVETRQFLNILKYCWLYRRRILRRYPTHLSMRFGRCGDVIVLKLHFI